jgi:hypothetical protein
MALFIMLILPSPALMHAQVGYAACMISVWEVSLMLELASLAKYAKVEAAMAN